MPTITLTITDAPGDEVDILAVFDELQHAPSCAHQVVLEIMARTRANWSIDIRPRAKTAPMPGVDIDAVHRTRRAATTGAAT